MIFPFLSVSVIGLIAGTGWFWAKGQSLGAYLGLALAGAWVGFVAGALVGVTVDVVTAQGVYVAIVGHAVAVAGAGLLPRRLRSRSV